MGLDCRQMTGVDYQCSNVSTCMENSPNTSIVKIIYYVLNQQICSLSDIQVDEKLLVEILQETQQDVESFLENWEI
jgi:hypothetical protein